MHKAFRAVSDRAEALIQSASAIEEIAELDQLFSFWIKQLVHHAAVEDELMTGPLQNIQSARDNETEHTDLAGKARDLSKFIARGNAAGLEESVRDAAFILEEEQYRELEEGFHEVEEAL